MSQSGQPFIGGATAPPFFVGVTDGINCCRVLLSVAEREAYTAAAPWPLSRVVSSYRTRSLYGRIYGEITRISRPVFFAMSKVDFVPPG